MGVQMANVFSFYVKMLKNNLVGDWIVLKLTSVESQPFLSPIILNKV